MRVKFQLMKLVLVAVTVALFTSPLRAANAWMQEARFTPKWFTSGVMYQIQPRAFTPEGTLKAAEEKLPYLKDLGVTIVYLVPVMKMDESMDRAFWSPRQIRSGFNNPKNQYRIADYFHVDSEYGTDEDLKDFVAKAHELGLNVMFDLVYLHCGPTAPFLKENPSFTWWNKDGTVKKGPWRFPKLNFAVFELRTYLLNNIRALLHDFGADGFRCDVGDGIPLDFWGDAHDMMDALTARHAVLLCEGHTVCNQYKGFDADYGWMPKPNAESIRKLWIGREKVCPRGARFVNHYENHDVATDVRPRREKAWGFAPINQLLLFMFTADGVPMLFDGNEFADDDEKHSMFGKTPIDWSRLEREPGKTRLAWVKRLAALRKAHPALTSVNGIDGLTWLDTDAPKQVTAFVRRGGNETVLVVQNWSTNALVAKVSFVAPKTSVPSYIVSEDVDRDVHGTVDQVLLAQGGEAVGPQTFKLAPWGGCVMTIKEPAK